MQVVLTLTKKGTINMTIANSNWGFSIGFNKATCEKKRIKFRSWQHVLTTGLVSAIIFVLANTLEIIHVNQTRTALYKKENI